MTTSNDVIEHIGDSDLPLPQRIQAGLAANDRVKYYLSLLQTAVSSARDPQREGVGLSATREASGVHDPTFDTVVEQSRPLADGWVLVPEASRIRELVFADLREMYAPLKAAQSLPATQSSCEGFERRLLALESTTPSFEDDRVQPLAVELMAAVSRRGDDTVHQLVMDLHRALNALQAQVPVHDVAGASTWGLTEADERLVTVFMEGLARTAALKFDHPGLETSATRAGGRLTIQNDLGTTTAHLVVLRIDGQTVTILYSDVHRRRAKFLQTMLARHDVEWEEGAATPTVPVMLVGRKRADTQDALVQFLAFLASRLVFLIDWNRARKQLSRFVRKSEAVAVLEWAADHAVGHRGFLQSGGAGLLYTALERAARTHAVSGGRLDEIFGRADATALLKSVLRIATAGVAAGRSIRLIQDEVEAELRAHPAMGSLGGLGLAADHAAYLSSLAERVRRMLLDGAGQTSRAKAIRDAALAKRWEARADEIVRRQRQRHDPARSGALLRRLLQQGDDAADALEEIAFLLTLVPDRTPEAALRPLTALADLTMNGCRDYVRCLEYGRHVPARPAGSDLEDFLVAVDRVLEFERAADRAERAARSTMLGTAQDYRQLHVLTAVARAFEQAADALAHGALTARDYALGGATDHA